MAIPPKPPPREAVPLVPVKPAHVGEYWAPEDDLSQADIVATLPPEEQAEILKGVDMARLQYDFKFWGRPSQLSAVNSEAWVTVCLAGRGWGKSRVLSEAIDKYAMENPGSRLLLLGRTAAEVREVMINGDSGVLNVVDPSHRPTWNQNNRRLTWPNGSFALCLSAEKADALRGQQFHAAFCDEIGSYKMNPGSGLMNAFDQVKVATRLGEFPRIFVATTPRRVPIITELVEQAAKEPDKVKLIRGSTLANRALSAAYKEAVVGMYEGTALGRQELDGELLMDVDGALLQQSVIDEHRRDDLGPTEFWKELPHRVIGIDPSVTTKPGDYCGIVAVGATGEKKLYKRQAFVLEDASIQGSPDAWARKAVEMARKYKAAIVAEANQGGELVKMVIQNVDPRVPVTLVHAKVGKKQRADPVGACYERGRVHHVDWFTKLEEELTTWSEESSNKSPDRMDACVARGTLVRMGDGSEKPIETIRVGETVLTRQGPKRVLAAQMTNPSTVVYPLTAKSTGRTLWATANHPVWSETRQDFVRMDALVGDMILTCNPHPSTFGSAVSATSALSTRKPNAPTRSTMRLPEDTHHAHTSTATCIEPTTDRYPTDITSTTSITTHSTTTPGISSPSVPQSTPESTPTNSGSGVDGTCVPMPYQPLHKKSETTQTPRSALDALRNAVGPRSSGARSLALSAALRSVLAGPEDETASADTAAMSGISTENPGATSASAPFAGDHSRLLHDSPEPSARWRVSAGHSGIVGEQDTYAQDPTSSLIGPADVAAPASRYERASRGSTAAGSAEPYTDNNGVGDIEVWNLEVEDAHEYFAEGILTHNCVWAITSLLVTPPKDWIGRVSVSGTARDRHLPDTRNHDPHRAAEPRRPVGQELADIKQRMFDIDPDDPRENGAYYDADEENIPRRVIPSQRSIPLSTAGDVGRSRTGPFGAPSIKIRHR